MAKRRVLAFMLSGAVPLPSVFEPTFDVAPDWYRLNNRTWLVVTDEPPEVWVERLKPHLVEGRVFIVELNLNTRWGLQSQEFWNWIDQYRD